MRLSALVLALFGLLPLLSPGSAAQQAPMRRIVLVLDGSLSMIVRDTPPNSDGTPAGPTRFDVAVADLRAALEHLAARPARWEFRIIAFGPSGNDTARLWSFPPEADRFGAPADVADAAAALEALRARGPQGHSALGAALREALGAHPTRVLLYTDGMPLSAATDDVPRAQVAILDSLKSLNSGPTRVPIDVVGVGAGVARAHHFLRTVAKDSGGFFVETD